jgi:hypothetical protein
MTSIGNGSLKELHFHSTYVVSTLRQLFVYLARFLESAKAAEVEVWLVGWLVG